MVDLLLLALGQPLPFPPPEPLLVCDTFLALVASVMALMINLASRLDSFMIASMVDVTRLLALCLDLSSLILSCSSFGKLFQIWLGKS